MEHLTSCPLRSPRDLKPESDCTCDHQPSWTVDRYGDIVVTCPPCKLTRRYRDTVDDVAWASELWKQHANHGQEDTP